MLYQTGKDWIKNPSIYIKMDANIKNLIIKLTLLEIIVFNKVIKNPIKKIIWIFKLFNFIPCKVERIFQIAIKLTSNKEEIIENIIIFLTLIPPLS